MPRKLGKFCYRTVHRGAAATSRSLRAIIKKKESGKSFEAIKSCPILGSRKTTRSREQLELEWNRQFNNQLVSLRNIWTRLIGKFLPALPVAAQKGSKQASYRLSNYLGVKILQYSDPSKLNLKESFFQTLRSNGASSLLAVCHV